MRNLVLSIIFLGIVGYLGSMLYDRAFLSRAQDDGHVYSYPATVNIKDAADREMLVTLLARSGTHIQFARQDSQEFVYPISSLDLATQALIRMYPNDGIKNALEVSEVAPQISIKDLHISGMNERLADLHEELRLLRGYRLPAAETNSQRRTVSNDIEAIKLKIRKVELKLAEHLRYQN
ncbi:MAG: hypothetical protein P8R37_06380 [Opitutae bacterium]|nr:hypothetical protein [Opitutae bacterium]